MFRLSLPGLGALPFPKTGARAFLMPTSGRHAVAIGEDAEDKREAEQDRPQRHHDILQSFHDAHPFVRLNTTPVAAA